MRRDDDERDRSRNEKEKFEERLHGFFGELARNEPQEQALALGEAHRREARGGV